MPVDLDGDNTESSARSVAVSLDEEETRALLQQIPARHVGNPAQHAEINALLLAALQQAFVSWMGERDLQIDLEGHGREDILDSSQSAGAPQSAGADISRTVGWFTTLYPSALARWEPGEPR